MDKKIKSYELRVAPGLMKLNNGDYFSIKANYDDGTITEFDRLIGMPFEDQKMLQMFISSLENCRGKVSKLNIILNEE